MLFACRWWVKWKITPISAVSWAKILVCSERWNILNFLKRKISLNLCLLSLNELTKLPLDNTIGYITEDATVNYWQEQNCRCRKKNDESTNISDEPGSSNGTSTKCIMHSDCEFSQQKSKNSLMLPPVCLICKTEKYIVDSHSGKRKKREACSMWD